MIKKILLLSSLLFPLIINAQTAFISGTHNLCDNENEVLIEIGFTGVPPFNFVYAIDNVNQLIIQNISDNPYFLSASNNCSPRSLALSIPLKAKSIKSRSLCQTASIAP